jgi:steroid delta-isomerase-like uncharacterized protein
MSAPTDIVNRYYRAINEGRWDLYDELFTADASLEGPGGVTGTGPAAMRAFDQTWKNAAPDFTVTVLQQVASDGRVMSENTAAGTHTGTLVLPVGEFPATGRPFGSKYVGVFEIDGGRIAAQHIYFDRLVVVETLGMPQPVAV